VAAASSAPLGCSERGDVTLLWTVDVLGVGVTDDADDADGWWNGGAPLRPSFTGRLVGLGGRAVVRGTGPSATTALSASGLGDAGDGSSGDGSGAA